MRRIITLGIIAGTVVLIAVLTSAAAIASAASPLMLYRG